MLNGKKAVIFDLDGTVVDSMWMWKQIDIDYLARFGIEMPEDLQSCIEGMSFTETAVYFKERFGINDELDEIKKSWNDMAWDIYENRVRLKPGVKEFLTELKKRGIKTGIATSNSKELVKVVLDKQDIAKYFDAVHTSCEVKKGKPAPDIYLLVAERLGVSPAECLVFEDIMQGIAAGKNAGMQVCAVDDDFSKEYRAEKAEAADYFIYDYTELLNPDGGSKNGD